MIYVSKAQKRERNELGEDRINGAYRNSSFGPGPEVGGTKGYDLNFRRNQLYNHEHGYHVQASISSIRRWGIQIHPKEMTGNTSIVKIRGIDLFNLIMYRMIYPYASADEVRRFLFENNPNNPTIFARWDIYRSEKIIGLTNKRGSTTASQAMEPHNIIRRWCFWNMPPPVGVLGVERHTLIDIDEAAFYMTTCNRKYGKSYSGVRVREVGPYGHSQKWTLIIAVSGDFKHATFRRVNGTNAQDFLHFIRGLILRLALTGQRKTFMFDNLRSHFSPQIFLEILQAGHNVVPRPAYYPEDAPIEFVINQVEQGLRKRLYQIRTEEDLIRNTYQVIGNLGNTDETFIHCGY